MKDKLKALIAGTIRTFYNVKQAIWLSVAAWRSGVHIHRKSPLRWELSVPHEGAFDGKEVTERNINFVIDLLKNAGIDYFVVRGKSRKLSVGVMVEHRQRVIELISGSEELKNFYYLIYKEKYNLWIPKLLHGGISGNDTRKALAITLYRNIGSSGRRIIDGSKYGVTVEFWHTEADLSPVMKQRVMAEAGIIDEAALSQSLIAPIENGVTRVVSGGDKSKQSLDIGGQKHPALRVFTNKLLSDVDFPIDVVYTWVDDSDPVWLDKYEKARQKLDSNFKNNSSARYANNDELRYSLRSIEMFAPWVRNIYIVTDSQTPTWLDESSSRIKVVDHRDIFSDTSALPVFNSHAIESQLHHIDGLSEHYLYLNDDVFIANPTLPETFFFASGIAKVQPSSAIIGTGNPTAYESAPSSAGKNARKIIEDKFGVFITNKFRHTAIPLIRSASYQVEKENRRVVGKTMHSKFRSPDDIPFTTVLMQSYLLASGQGAPVTYPAKTVGNLASRGVKYEINDIVRDSGLVTFCLNEVPDQDEAVARMNQFLEKYYPYPASWETVED